MQTPLSITFQELDPSEAVEAAIRDKVAKLEQFHDRITSCRVVVARPHARGRKGHLFQVRVELALPGTKNVMVTRDHGLDHGHEDVYVALRDAFDAARRQLQDHHRRRDGKVKHHGPTGGDRPLES